MIPPRAFQPAASDPAHRSVARALMTLSPLLLLCGCGRSPAFNVLGSYFPGWIACILLGIVFAVGVRMVAHRFEWEARISALPLFYLSIAAAIACLFWLIAFE